MSAASGITELLDDATRGISQEFGRVTSGT